MNARPLTAAPKPEESGEFPAEADLGPASIELARVKEATDDGLQIETEAGLRAARVAPSCLLEPEPGDLVLLARAATDTHVLAVLERDPSRPARVRLGANAQLLAAGDLSVLSAGTLGLAGAEGLRIDTARLDVRAEEGELFIERLITRSRAILARAGALEAVFDTIDTAADRLTQRLGRAYRFVDGTDLTRAEDIDAQAKESFLVRAKDALFSARRLVKVDGEQIHLG